MECQTGDIIMKKEEMPLSEIRRILERGEWWDYVCDVSPEEPPPFVAG